MNPTTPEALLPDPEHLSVPPAAVLSSSQLAWQLSLGLHSLLLALVLLAALGGDNRWTGRLVCDTRVPGPAVDVCILLAEPPASPSGQAPVPQPASIAGGSPADPAAEAEDIGPAPAPAASVSRPGIGQAETLPGTLAGRQAPSGGLSREGQGGPTSFFQVTAHGRSFVYVIDRSASMGRNGALEAAKRELLASLELLPPETWFQIIAYNRDAQPLRIGGRTDLVPVTEENKRQVARLCESLNAEGGTEHLGALKRALLLQPDVIFFLTDADDLKAEHVQEVSRLNGGRRVIHTIELSPPNHHRNHRPLQVLARANHGQHRAVDLREVVRGQ